jgi:hypothetical protein
MKPTKSILLFALAMCACARAADPSTNQTRVEATLVVTLLEDGRPVVTARGKDESKTGVPVGEIVQHRETNPLVSAEVLRQGHGHQWRTNYSLLSKALVEAAEKQHLDSASLAKILQKLPSARRNPDLALLPKKVESTKYNGQWAWKIRIWADDDRDVVYNLYLSISRDLIFSQETLNQLGDVKYY